jgi:hypothetical protein
LARYLIIRQGKANVKAMGGGGGRAGFIGEGHESGSRVVHMIRLDDLEVYVTEYLGGGMKGLICNDVL